ncbi:putative protein N(5)-glutamine methyltransferase [Paenibacillus sp. P26]|nr:putative protein N(5)-glutamine methyltransferase [Paenibacillus sp. P26]
MNPKNLEADPAYFPLVARLRSAGCVFAEEEARSLFSAAQGPEELASMADRRAAGSPLEHVIGWTEFCGLRIAVEPDVFVPRQRTEFLARHAVSLAQPGAVVLDLCCGSGALGAVLAAALEGIELHAADLDPVAVKCARRNTAEAGGRVYEGDLYEPPPPALRGRVDILLANVPYVPTEAIRLLPAEARMYEARLALDGERMGSMSCGGWRPKPGAGCRREVACW